MRNKRRVRIAVVVAVAIVLCALALYAPRYVRARAIAEAARRGYAITIGEVRFGWRTVRLRRVHVDGAALRADLAEVKVELSGRFEPERVRLVGGDIAIDDRERATASESGSRLPVGGEALAVTWPAKKLAARGVSFEREDGRIVAFAREVRRDDERASIDAEGVYAVIDRGVLAELSAARARVVVQESPPPSAPPSGEPDWLARLRARAARATNAIAMHLPSSGRVAIGALSFARGELAFGPGEFLARREGDRLVVSFTAHGASPLHVTADLPRTNGEARVGVRGGPITLAALGFPEGAVGVLDTDRATLEGRADATLGERSLDLDVDLHATDLAVQNRRLARDPVRGIALGVRARAEVDASGHVAIDGAEWSLGALRLRTRGAVDVTRGRVAASLDLALPEERCQALLDGAPPSLVATARGLTWSGTLSARARLAFDSDKPHALALDYDVKDACTVSGVPEHLAKERFRARFAHRVYAPDGTIRDTETGPGTPGWTPLAAMGRFLPIAIVMTEDGGIFRRSGFNRAQIKYALEVDLAERRFARGASTLTMQLAKNLFLSREKTLARKLEEVILTEYLSQRFSQDEILELYLNIVEFGPDVYGARAAAAHYFGKAPSQLTLREALFLAALLPSPLKLHALKGNLPDAYLSSFDRLIDMARQNHLVSDADAQQAVAEPIVFR